MHDLAPQAVTMIVVMMVLVTVVISVVFKIVNGDSRRHGSLVARLSLLGGHTLRLIARARKYQNVGW
jgi:hypothetical protein